MSKRKPKKPVDVPIDPGTAEFKEPEAADPPPLADSHVKLGISDGPEGTRIYKDGELVHEGPPGGLNAALALTGELIGRDEPGPVRPSEEAEAVRAFLATLHHDGPLESRPTDADLNNLASALVRRFPGLTRKPAVEERQAVIADLRSRAKELRDVFHNEGDAEKLEALAGTYEYALNDKRPVVLPSPEEPLAFNGGSNVLLEFNGDSWAAMCNAASGAGYVRQTRAEGADLKTPQAALAAVLKLVRERAKGVSQ